MAIFKRKSNTTVEKQMKEDALLFKASFTIADREGFYRQTYRLSHKSYFDLQRQLVKIFPIAHSEVLEMEPLLPSPYWRFHMCYADFDNGGYSGTGGGGAMYTTDTLKDALASDIMRELRGVARRHGGAHREKLLDLTSEFLRHGLQTAYHDVLSDTLRLIDSFEELLKESR